MMDEKSIQVIGPFQNHSTTCHKQAGGWGGTRACLGERHLILIRGRLEQGWIYHNLWQRVPRVNYPSSPKLASYFHWKSSSNFNIQLLELIIFFCLLFKEFSDVKFNLRTFEGNHIGNIQGMLFPKPELVQILMPTTLQRKPWPTRESSETG